MRLALRFSHVLLGLLALACVACGEPLVDFASEGLLPRAVRVAHPEPTTGDAVAAFIGATDSGIHAQIMSAPQYNVLRYLSDEAITEVLQLFGGMAALDARVWGTRYAHKKECLTDLLPEIWTRLRASTEMGQALSRHDALLRNTKIRFADLRGKPLRAAVAEIDSRFQAARVGGQDSGRLRITTPAILRPCTYVRDNAFGRRSTPPVVATPSAEISVLEALGENWRYAGGDTVEVECEHHLLRASESTVVSHEGRDVWVESRLVDVPRSRFYYRDAAWEAPTPSSVDAALDLARKTYGNDSVELVALRVWFSRARGRWYHSLRTCEQLDERKRFTTGEFGVYRGTLYVAEPAAASAGTQPTNSFADAMALACTKQKTAHKCEYAVVYGRGADKTAMPYFVWATDEAHPAPGHGLPYIVYPDGRVAGPRVFREAYEATE